MFEADTQRGILLMINRLNIDVLVEKVQNREKVVLLASIVDHSSLKSILQI